MEPGLSGTGELSAVLGAAYEAFILARLERRSGRRGTVHARSVRSFIEMVGEVVEVVGVGGHDTDVLWLMAIAELDRDRGEIEADVLIHHGFVVPEHEWGAFLGAVEQVRGS